MNVLFVCTGNTLRSMVAEYLLRAYAQQQGSDLTVSSAGTLGNPLGPFPQTIELLRQRGIDASGHVPRVVDEHILAEADVIICMAKHHQQYLKEHFNADSELFNRIAVGEATDIKDDGESGITEHDPQFEAFLRHHISVIESRIPLIYRYTQDI